VANDHLTGHATHVSRRGNQPSSMSLIAFAATKICSGGVTELDDKPTLFRVWMDEVNAEAIRRGYDARCWLFPNTTAAVKTAGSSISRRFDARPGAGERAGRHSGCNSCRAQAADASNTTGCTQSGQAIHDHRFRLREIVHRRKWDEVLENHPLDRKFP
jgi:hypothetical protein